MAAIDQELGFETRATVMIDYLVAQAGGKDGTYLKDLVRYEKLLQVKREIKMEGLQKMSDLDLQHKAPRYPTALCKAMLARPKELFEQGVCALFNVLDFDKAKPNGKLYEHVLEAHNLVIKAFVVPQCVRARSHPAASQPTH